MNQVSLGVVNMHSARDSWLSAAATRVPNVSITYLEPDSRLDDEIVGVIVDVPLENRGDIIWILCENWNVPLLVQTPAANSIERIAEISMLENSKNIFSFNPLEFHVPTQSLKQELAAEGDSLQNYYTSWRLQKPGTLDQDRIHLIDYLSSLVDAPPVRISAMQSHKAEALLALIRYENNVIGHIEFGSYVPDSFAAQSELIIECFQNESVFHCYPDKQSIVVESNVQQYVDWSPSASDRMVSAFVNSIYNGQRSRRSIERDKDALAVDSLIMQSAASREVWEPRSTQVRYMEGINGDS